VAAHREETHDRINILLPVGGFESDSLAGFKRGGSEGDWDSEEYAAARAVANDAASASLTDTPATASTLAYLESGESIRRLTDVALKVCLAVILLVALAWVLGVLPGAVKLF
jgi:hypothetical protein